MRKKYLVTGMAILLIFSLSLFGFTLYRKNAGPEIAHSDNDGVPDHIEKKYKLDHTHFDTDRDGLPDGYELEKAGILEKESWATTPESISYLEPTAARAAGTTALHTANNEWDGGFKYSTTKTVANLLVSDLASEKGWWTGKTDAHSPTVSEVNDAVLARLIEVDKTRAPLLDDDPKTGYEQFPDVKNDIDPNWDAAPGSDKDPKMPLSPALAKKLWTGVDLTVKVHVGFRDADNDGIANAYESYGFKLLASEDGNDLAPWGIGISGKSHYDPAQFKFIKTTDGKDFIGSDYEVVADGKNDHDYSIAYFKTNPIQATSDWDPTFDLDEAIKFDGGLYGASSTNHPAIAARPLLVPVLDDFTIAYNISNTNGGGSTKPELGPSDFDKSKSLITKVWDDHIKPFSKKLLGMNEPAILQPATAMAEGTALAYVSDGLNAASSVNAFLAPKPTGKIISAMTQSVSNPAHAADLSLSVRIANNGSYSATDARGEFNVFQLDELKQQTKLIKTVKFGNKDDTYTFKTGTTSDGAPFRIDSIPLTLNQVNELTAGAGGISLNINESSLHCDSVIPLTDNSGTQTQKFDTTADWSAYNDLIDSKDAMVIIDNGENGFIKVPVTTNDLRGGTKTVKDAVQWALGEYTVEGSDFRLTGLMMRGPNGKQKLAANLDEFIDSGKWGFVFSEVYTDDKLDLSDPFAVHLQPSDLDGNNGVSKRSVIYIFNRDIIIDSPFQSAQLSPHGGVEIIDGEEKTVQAVVKLHLTDVSGLKVWMKPTPEAPGTQWVRLVDTDNGVYKAVLPADYRHTLKETIFIQTSFCNDPDLAKSVPLIYAAPSAHKVTVKASYPDLKDEEYAGQIAFLDLDDKTGEQALNSMATHPDWADGDFGRIDDYMSVPAPQRGLKTQKDGAAFYSRYSQKQYLKFAKANGAELAVDLNSYAMPPNWPQAGGNASIYLHLDDSNVTKRSYPSMALVPTTPSSGFEAGYIKRSNTQLDYYTWPKTHSWKKLLEDGQSTVNSSPGWRLSDLQTGRANLLAFRYSLDGSEIHGADPSFAPSMAYLTDKADWNTWGGATADDAFSDLMNRQNGNDISNSFGYESDVEPVIPGHVTYSKAPADSGVYWLLTNEGRPALLNISAKNVTMGSKQVKAAPNTQKDGPPYDYALIDAFVHNNNGYAMSKNTYAVCYTAAPQQLAFDYTVYDRVDERPAGSTPAYSPVLNRYGNPDVQYGPPQPHPPTYDPDKDDLPLNPTSIQVGKSFKSSNGSGELRTYDRTYLRRTGQSTQKALHGTYYYYNFKALKSTAGGTASIHFYSGGSKEVTITE